VREQERLDGKFVVHSNDDTLNAEDMALGYKQLQRVEEAWRTLKSGLRLRPVYHYVPHRVHAHVFLSVLALLLERIAEQACGDTWRNIRDDLKGIKLAQLLSPNGTVWQVTEPAPEAANRLKSLEIPNPPPLLQVG
jgi:transposase